MEVQWIEAVIVIKDVEDPQAHLGVAAGESVADSGVMLPEAAASYHPVAAGQG